MKQNKMSIIKIISLVCYIFCVVILIAEASINGTDSANHSNNIGNTIAGIINNLGGDKTTIIEPTSVSIDNKTTKAYIGDVFKLNTTILPEDSSYKSLLYKSSDNNIASINESGQITCKNEGMVNIQVINEYNNSLKDSFVLTIEKVLAQSLTARIANAIQDENGIYTLYVENNDDYYIEAAIKPKNVTDRKVKVHIDKPEYLSFNSGKLTDLKDSRNEIITITLTTGNISCDLKLIIDTKNKIKLTSINVLNNKDKIYVGEKTTLDISFLPENASYQDYIIKADKSDIVLINENSITGINPGKVILTIQSLYDKSITTSIELEVLNNPAITSFELKNDSFELIEKQEAPIEFNSIEPTIYGDLSSLIITIEDNSVATVLSLKDCIKIKALKEGNTTIKVNEKIITVKVKKYNPKDFDSDYIEKENHIIGFNLINKESIITSNQNKSLDELFNITEDNWLYDETNNTINVDKTIRFYKNKNELITNTNLLTPGKYNLMMLHLASGFNVEVSLVVLDDCFIYDLNNIKLDSNQIINIKSKDEFSFTLNNIKNNYKIVLTDQNDNLTDDLLISKNKTTYTLKAIFHEGNFKLKIIPIVDYIAYDNYAKVYQIKVSHNYLKNIEYSIFDANDNILPIIDNSINIYMNQLYYLSQEIASDVTKYNISYSSANEKIVKITNRGIISPISIGNTYITIKDKCSNLEKIINVNVDNLILINQEQKVTITGNDSSYDSTQDIYNIKNGISSNLKVNFLSNSTYKKASYSVENNSILSISKDGTITPHKVGKTKILIRIDDGKQQAQNIEITIQVNKQTLIKNLTDFLVKTRKALGHFGAFMIMGIFSTLTYMLYIKKNKWDKAILINLLQGFFIASLTEIIQLFVPSRSGLFSDVIIDFSGFLISSLILTILFLNHYRNNKRQEIKRIIRRKI